MKLITENEDFIKARKHIGLDKPYDHTTNLLRAGFDAGAKTCQSILQSEHDKEVEKFAQWCLDDNKGPSITRELLQLFRKEQGNE